MPNVWLLVIGGGGSGGREIASLAGAGGGAGEYWEQASYALTAGSYAITIGAGGNNANGSDTTFDSLVTAVGGGKGGQGDGASNTAGSNGGSGGGGGGGGNTVAGGSSTASAPGVGFAGGGGETSGNQRSGGGGGAGALGVAGTSGGAGGVGVQSSITGTPTYRGGGGGGGSTTPGGGGAGGSGGGGMGLNSGGNATAGTANTGGGGGGDQGAYRSGGSGVVIIRYTTTDYGTCSGGDVVAVDGTATVRTFNANGTLVLGTVTLNAPTSPAAAPVSGTPTSMTVTWTDTNTSETHYKIERSPNGSSGWAEVGSVAADITSFGDTGLSADTTYYYRIRAYNSGNAIYSDYSSTASGQTGPATPTGPACAAADGSTSLTITWTDVSTSETGYRVERSDDGVSGWSNVSGSLSAGATQYVDAVGANSTTKYYRVVAFRSSIDSGNSSVVSAKTAPAAPSGAAVVAVDGNYNLTVTWTDNSSDETSFSIERSNDGASGWAEVGTVSSGIVTYSDTSIGVGDTTRYYRIRAIRSGDGIDSAYSGTANGTTSPQAPSSFAAAISMLIPTLTWADNSTTNTSYVLERKLGSGAYATIGNPTANAVTYVDSALDQGKTYTYRLKAARSSDSKNSPSITLEISIPPEEPTNLNAACSLRAESNGSKVRLWWEIQSLEETGFLIERSLNGSSWSTVTTTAAGIREYENTGLAHDTTYYYRVSAVGSAATSVPTATVTVKTSRGRVADLLLAFDKKTGTFPS